MASGILDADKIRKEKSKWGECNKVYTRRRKQVNNHTAVTATVSATADSPVTEAAPGSPVTEAATGSPITTAENEQTLDNEDAHSRRERQPLSGFAVASSDFPRQSLPHAPEGARNGTVKPIATLVDNRVKIHLDESTPRSAKKDFREKLILELDQVQRLFQKLEDREAAIGRSMIVLGATNNDDSRMQLHYPGNVTVDRRSLLRVNSEMGAEYMDRRALSRVPLEIGSDNIDTRALVRVNSELGPFVNRDMSRFRQLSVSVGEFVEKEKRTPKANQYYRNSDFLLGKDRLPPESNKKLKSNGGRKSEYSVGLERHKNQVFRSCSNLLQRLLKHKFGWVFKEPVNAKALGLPDYHDIIKHPMDFGTIKSRLAQSFYKTPGEFAEDVRLTFHNAMTYNTKGQDVHYMAEQLSDIFEEKWAVIESDWRYGPVHETPVAKVHNFRTLDRSQSMGLPLMARPKPASFAPVTRKPAQKKPKAKDLNKRDMTHDEKQKLSANLQELPSEKLDSIVQIINKSNTSLSQNDDEIEVDIDSVDVETLWELDRFVTNYKKNLSKHRRKAEQARALAGNTNQPVLQNPAASVPEHLSENRTDQPNPAGVQPNQGGDNISSSSSSSSDSRTSSSDSDSDSSSDGSAAGH